MERGLFLMEEGVEFSSTRQFCPDIWGADKRRWRIKKIILASVLVWFLLIQ
jgi:hypothetical protein